MVTKGKREMLLNNRSIPTYIQDNLSVDKFFLTLNSILESTEAIKDLTTRRSYLAC